MTIFDHLKDIIQHKNLQAFEDDEELESFIPFLVQRWLSMHSGGYAMICNETSNKMWRSMEDKWMWYKLFMSVIPKQRMPRIPYIKKLTKIKKKAPKDEIDILAQKLEISERECKMYIEQDMIDLKQFRKEVNL